MSGRLLYSLIMTGWLMQSCVTTRHYAQAEQDLCDCLSGIKPPADEFCTEWNEAAQKEADRLDIKMARLSGRNPEKYEALLLQLELIKEEHDSCMARISRFYGG